MWLQSRCLRSRSSTSYPYVYIYYYLIFASFLLQICVADIDKEQGQATTTELQAKHGEDNVIFVSCNVTSDDDFKGEQFLIHWYKCKSFISKLKVFCLAYVLPIGYSATA